jgi:hypothetical protein
VEKNEQQICRQQGIRERDKKKKKALILHGWEM